MGWAGSRRTAGRPKQPNPRYLLPRLHHFLPHGDPLPLPLASNSLTSSGDEQGSQDCSPGQDRPGGCRQLGSSPAACATHEYCCSGLHECCCCASDAYRGDNAPGSTASSLYFSAQLSNAFPNTVPTHRCGRAWMPGMHHSRICGVPPSLLLSCSCPGWRLKASALQRLPSALRPCSQPRPQPPSCEGPRWQGMLQVGLGLGRAPAHQGSGYLAPRKWSHRS